MRRPSYPLESLRALKQVHRDSATAQFAKTKQALTQAENDFELQKTVNEQHAVETTTLIAALGEEGARQLSAAELQCLGAYLARRSEEAKELATELVTREKAVSSALVSMEAARKVVQTQNVQLKTVERHKEQWQKQLFRERQVMEQEEMDEQQSVKYKIDR